MSDLFMEWLERMGQFNDVFYEVCRLVDPLTRDLIEPYSSTRMHTYFGIQCLGTTVQDPLKVIGPYYRDTIHHAEELYRQYIRETVTRRQMPHFKVSKQEIYVYKANSQAQPHLEVYKIGITKCSVKRFKAYRTAIPDFHLCYCQPVCDRFVEKMVHNSLAPYRLDQHEFFNVGLPIIIETIRRSNDFMGVYRAFPGNEDFLEKQLVANPYLN